MAKITFMGAGSAVFTKNVAGDCMLRDTIGKDLEFALYDISQKRVDEAYVLVQTMNEKILGGKAVVKKYAGVENRLEALRGADFVFNTIQVGGYDPCTIIDFEIPKKYGLRQTIADTLGIGGIFRALRTIPVVRDFAEDMAKVCPNAWFFNYTNPMAMVSNYMQRYTDIKTLGLCHSVQICSQRLLDKLDIKVDGFYDTIAGINHMGWLLDIRDSKGNDLYPLIRQRAAEKNAKEKHDDMVRFEYINKLGYYCTESSEHNAEYNPFFIKSKYPELIDKYNIPLDEYIRRCKIMIESWDEEYQDFKSGKNIKTEMSEEYGSVLVEAMMLNKPCRVGGNVLNTGLITNLPQKATVEVTCMVDKTGVLPTYVGELPLQLAAMNSSNIYPQLLTVEAAATGKKEYLYQAAMMEPHTAAELSIDDIVAMCDEMLEAHANAGFKCL